jgi:7-cyano-7-deazaguanine synthase in queuosine biosynthesis
MSLVEARVGTKQAKRPIDFAEVHIDGLATEIVLRVRYEQVPKLSLIPPEAVQDLLVVAAAVYSLDKSVRRESTRGRWNTDDNWTREYVVTVPVADPTSWIGAANKLGETVSFLTGDHWEFCFEHRKTPLLSDALPRRARTLQADAVALFSGGLDSLIGSIDWLDGNEGRLALVGHSDPSVKGPKGDQGGLVPRLLSGYDGRATWINVGVGNAPNGPETSYRSRSIVFIAIGALVAECVGKGTRLMVPENGTIAVNPPLSPSRSGACSTRTTHPQFLEGLQEVLAAVGLTSQIHNPYIFRTKGQMVEECTNRALLLTCLGRAISCAKRSHRREWRRREATHCGRCMPCLYRRAALQKIGQDRGTDYGLDAIGGEVDPRANKIGSEDLRALLGFVSENMNVGEMEMLLVENGRLSPDDLEAHAKTVLGALGEVRQLIQAQGVAEIKRLAGVP